MLVLTRKYQEKIRIGNDITITVLRTKGKAVRLGIEAPTTVPVIRGELQFEGETAQNTPAETDGVEASTGGSGPRHHDAVAQPSWTTKPRRRADSRGGVGVRATDVAHRRVPRERVSELVPRLVTGNAPLRALMDQRSTTV